MKHHNVPYYGNPTNSFCALACATMIAEYLLPGESLSFEAFGEMADYRPGYVIWLFPLWKWLMDHGIHIHDIDVSDMRQWAREGVEGLRRSQTPEEFAWYQKNTYDLEALTDQVGLVMDHPNFSYTQKRATWDDLLAEFSRPGICDVTLNGKLLHHADGFSVHRVVILDITKDEVVFHDPRVDGRGAESRASLGHFRSAFENLASAEVCRYWK